MHLSNNGIVAAAAYASGAAASFNLGGWTIEPSVPWFKNSHSFSTSNTTVTATTSILGATMVVSSPSHNRHGHSARPVKARNPEQNPRATINATSSGNALEDYLHALESKFHPFISAAATSTAATSAGSVPTSKAPWWRWHTTTVAAASSSNAAASSSNTAAFSNTGASSFAAQLSVAAASSSTAAQSSGAQSSAVAASSAVASPTLPPAQTSAQPTGGPAPPSDVNLVLGDITSILDVISSELAEAENDILDGVTSAINTITSGLAAATTTSFSSTLAAASSPPIPAAASSLNLAAASSSSLSAASSSSLAAVTSSNLAAASSSNLASASSSSVAAVSSTSLAAASSSSVAATSSSIVAATSLTQAAASSNTVANAIPSSAPQKIGNFDFIGCFSSADSFSSFTLATQSVTNSLTSCTTQCLAINKKYAGIYGQYCYCADNFDLATTIPTSPSNCNIPCPGSPDQTCGGNLVTSRFKRQLASGTLFTVYEDPNIEIGSGSSSSAAVTSGVAAVSSTLAAASSSAAVSSSLNVASTTIGAASSPVAVSSRITAVSSTLVAASSSAIPSSSAAAASSAAVSSEVASISSTLAAASSSAAVSSSLNTASSTLAAVTSSNVADVTSVAGSLLTEVSSLVGDLSSELSQIGSALSTGNPVLNPVINALSSKLAHLTENSKTQAATTSTATTSTAEGFNDLSEINSVVSGLLSDLEPTFTISTTFTTLISSVTSSSVSQQAVTTSASTSAEGGFNITSIVDSVISELLPTSTNAVSLRSSSSDSSTSSSISSGTSSVSREFSESSSKSSSVSSSSSYPPVVTSTSIVTFSTSQVVTTTSTVSSSVTVKSTTATSSAAGTNILSAIGSVVSNMSTPSNTGIPILQLSIAIRDVPSETPILKVPVVIPEQQNILDGSKENKAPIPSWSNPWDNGNNLGVAPSRNDATNALQIKNEFTFYDSTTYNVSGSSAEHVSQAREINNELPVEIQQAFNVGRINFYDSGASDFYYVRKCVEGPCRIIQIAKTCNCHVSPRDGEIHCLYFSYTTRFYSSYYKFSAHLPTAKREVVGRSTSLDEVAKHYGIDLPTLRAANPNGINTEINIPAQGYVSNGRESLVTIAEKMNTAIEVLARYNTHLDAALKSTLPNGTTIKIPPQILGAPFIHSVQVEGTLRDLSKTWNTTAEILQKLNPSIQKIYPGLIVNVPVYLPVHGDVEFTENVPAKDTKLMRSWSAKFAASKTSRQLAVVTIEVGPNHKPIVGLAPKKMCGNQADEAQNLHKDLI